MKIPQIILIPNATGAQNIGDAAMLESLIKGIQVAYPDTHLVIHSSNHQSYAYLESDHITLKDQLYYWSIFGSCHLQTKCLRFFQVLLAVLLPHKVSTLLLSSHIADILRDYDQANLVVFPGGGYFRSQKGIKQFFNSLMQLLPYCLAVRRSKSAIQFPISVGPFGHKWTEFLTVRLLKCVKQLSVREIYSYNLLRKYSLRNVILSTDHALLLPKLTFKSTKKLILGFTIRTWLRLGMQSQLESAYIGAITALIRKFPSIEIQPIVQVDAPEYGENDLQITRYIASELKQLGVKVLPVHKVQSVADAQQVYGSLQLLLGMRMHSNILAAVQHTPFVAIAYEHKTLGIAQDLGMQQWVLDVDQVNEQNLTRLLERAWKERVNTKKVLTAQLQKLVRREHQRWVEILEQVGNH